jgi:hypothetical protein
VPGEGRQRERGQRQETEQYRAGDPDRPGDAFGDEPGHQPDHACREAALPDVRIEIGRAHVREHAHHVRHQHAETHDEDRDPLHVETAESVESCQGESDPEQRYAQRPRAEQLPERVADVAAEPPGDLDRQQRQAEKESHDQGGEGSEPTTSPPVAGCEQRCGGRAHTGTAASVTRRSWKVGSTG